MIAGGAGALLGGLVGGAMQYRAMNKPHVTTSPGEAKKKLKLDDEDLRRILRGEAVRKEEIKTTDHYIKIK